MQDKEPPDDLNYQTFPQPEFVEIEYLDCLINNTSDWWSLAEIEATKEMPIEPMIVRGWLMAEDDNAYMLMFLRLGKPGCDNPKFRMDAVIQKGPGTKMREIQVIDASIKLFPDFPEVYYRAHEAAEHAKTRNCPSRPIPDPSEVPLGHDDDDEWLSGAV